MALNPLEKIQHKHATSSITIQGRKIRVTATVGVLSYLGLTPDASVRDISQAGVDLSYTRKGHKRARWYGDSGGATVRSTVVNTTRYPLSNGGTLPGRPVEFEALTDTGGDAQGRKVTGTVELSGPFGWFVAYMTQHRPTHSIRLKSPRGKFLAAPLLSKADFDALQ